MASTRRNNFTLTEIRALHQLTAVTLNTGIGPVIRLDSAAHLSNRRAGLSRQSSSATTINLTEPNALHKITVLLSKALAVN